MPATQNEGFAATSIHPEAHSLLAELRRGARPDKARIAAYNRFAEGRADYRAYHAFLSAHARWLAALDEVLSAAAREYDLPAPAPHGRPPDPDPSLARPRESIPAIRSRSEALGYLYVSEAFRLGDSVLERELGSFGVDHDDTGHAPPAWRRLLEAVRRALPEEHGAAVQGAAALFSAWERWIAPLRAQLEAS